jgi:hypothetical protein
MAGFHDKLAYNINWEAHDKFYFSISQGVFINFIESKFYYILKLSFKAKDFNFFIRTLLTKKDNILTRKNNYFHL